MLKGVLIGIIVVATVEAASAQSLADVARAEAARRKTVKGHAKVYTNDTLRGADGGEAPAPPPPSAPQTPASGTATTGAAGTAAKPGATPGAKPPAPPPSATPKDEKYWRDRLSTARDALQRSQTLAEALQNQINSLYTEFVNMSDPAQRALIEQKRLAAIAEQDRMRADIAKFTKAVADIEDEARRANVPAGWLR